MENLGYLLGGLVIAGVMFFLGFFISRRVGESKIASAEKLAEKIVSEAKREAGTYKKVAEIEIKEQREKTRETFQKETREQRRELSQLEKKISDKDANLDRKSNFLIKKEKDLSKRERDIILKEKMVKAKDERYSQLIEEENLKLERIAGMTKEQAKQRLMSNLEERARYEAAQMMKEIKDRAKEQADREAKEIITVAIQRCATDHVVESTVSVVSLPSDEMKGRIIGREGRNIRAFETATGVEVVIDDTPEAVALSGFDPIRREIARIALEKLVTNGRIHPGRIEEVVQKTEREMEEIVKGIGEETVLEVGLAGVHPELVNLIGRLRYRTSYGQNVLQHSKEVAYIAALMAQELNFDSEEAKRAGLLHDIGKAIDQSVEGTHATIGADIAGKYGESPLIVNAISAHHEDVEPESPLAVLIQAADAISGARPGARRETLEAYVKRLERLEEIAGAFSGVEKSYAIQAGREVRIIVEPEKITDLQAAELAAQVAKRIEAELKYPGQIKVTVLRETRAVDYAK